jgi:hypothetical protein
MKGYEEYSRGSKVDVHGPKTQKITCCTRLSLLATTYCKK